MNPLEQLPLRFQQHTFRKWEPIIKTAVELLPSPLVLPPRTEYSQETVACGVRNAMKSLWDNGWPSTVDVAKFRENYESMEVARSDQNVSIQLRRKRIKTVDATAPSTLSIDNPTDEEIHAAIVLRSGQRIAPIMFTGVAQGQRLMMIEVEKLNKVAFNFNDAGILMV